MWTTNWESGTCHDTPFSISFITNSCYTWKPTHLIIHILCDSQKWQPQPRAQEENQPSVTSDCEAQSALALLAFASLVKFPGFKFSSKSSVLQPLFSSHSKIIFRVLFCLSTSDPSWVNLYVSMFPSVFLCTTASSFFSLSQTSPPLSSSFEQVLI